MEPINVQPAHKKGNNKRKTNVRIDMTPMVDLGFLLITFFIFTTTMAESKATVLTMPKEGKPMDVADSKAMTVLLSGSDNVFVYEGSWEKARLQQKIKLTSYDLKNGLGNFIRIKQHQLGKDKNELMILVKPAPESSYNNVINSLDEMLINGVSRYAIVNITPEELAYLKANK